MFGEERWKGIAKTGVVQASATSAGLSVIIGIAASCMCI